MIANIVKHCVYIYIYNKSLKNAERNKISRESTYLQKLNNMYNM